MLCLIFFQVTATRLDPDLGWHLRVGEEILESGEAPRFDTFSHTMPGHAWIDHEWLADAALAFLEQNDLWLVAVIVFTLLAALPFAVWLWRISTVWEFLVLALAAALMVNHIGVRAQIITFFLFFLILEILQKRQRFAFWFLPLLFLAWVNLHGGFILGLAVLGIFVVFTDQRLKGSIVLGASFALTFANPYTWQIYQEIFSVLSSSDTARYIAEWQSALVQPAMKSSTTVAVFLIVGQLSFVAMFLWFSWHYRRRYSLPLLVTAVLLFFGYMKSLRNGPLFFVAALPVLAQGAALLREEVARLRQGHEFTSRDLTVFKLFKLSAAVFILAFAFLLMWSPGLSRGYPVAAVNYLRASMTPDEIGNLFNDYAWGGYLIQNLPSVKVFIDGRMPHWVDENGYSAMAEYTSVFYPPRGADTRFFEVAAEHSIQTILIRAAKCEETEFSTRAFFWTYSQKLAEIPCLIQAKAALTGWETVYKDRTAVILRKM